MKKRGIINVVSLLVIVFCATTCAFMDSPKKELTRRDKIDRQFSSWDGCHLPTKKYLKKRLLDPDSFEVIETNIRDRKDHILVTTTYRAKNRLGGFTIERINIETDIDGAVIGVFEE